MNINSTKAQFPVKLKVLFEPHRYKVLLGGRGGAKSWGIARALLILGAQKPLRILCARETQKSIADSVHHLLESQIEELGLRGVYLVEKARIIGSNGTEFIFAGLRHNINNIKSVEACDIVWVEEAQAVSKSSWDVLIPTIRKDGSEIWISFNPELESDDTYKRFVLAPPPSAVVVRVNWRDNPWFPQVLREEMEHLKATNQESYQHVYEGHCKTTVDGAIYGNELRNADAEGRVTRVMWDAARPVHTAWDLGFGDAVAVWFFQALPFEFRFIDYMEGSQQAIGHYLKRCQEKPYLYGTFYLPWDGGAKSLGTGKSIEDLMRAAGRTVQVCPQLAVHDGINAARTIFPQCWFDGEKCADGLQALRHYRYEVKEDPKAPLATKPLHDWASHPADAFRTAAVGVRRPEAKKPAASAAHEPEYSWMA